MSERYSKLFSLEENLYTEGSPVIIQAGALQKDNQSGRVLAQLRFKNISDKVIESISVMIISFDTAGRQLEDVVEYQYLDLHAERDAEFGSKQPIYLSNITMRSFNVSLTEVVFSDKSIWQDANPKWDRLQIATPVTIGEYLERDFDLIEQYELNMGNSCYCLPEKERDIWICGCDAINHGDEETCHRCGRTFEELIQSLDVDILKTQATARLELKRQEEDEKRIANEKAIAEKKNTIKKVVKIILKISLLLIIISLITVAGFFASKFISKNNTYNNALDMVEAKQYNEAIEVFKTLADFRDSEEQIKEATYKKATDFLNNNQLDEAMEAFYLLGDYKDSSKTLNGMWYDKAIALSVEGNYKEAIKYFSLADDYGDSKALLNHNQELAYQEACKMLSENNLTEAAMLFGSAGDYNDAQKQSMALWDGIAKRNRLLNDGIKVVAVKKDGTLIYDSKNDISTINTWKDIVAIDDADSDTIVGLKKDGTVVVSNEKWMVNSPTKWTNVVDIVAGTSLSHVVVGLKTDGTVLCNLSSLKVGSEEHDKYVNSAARIIYELSRWSNIVDISGDGLHVVGLKSDGTVVAAGFNHYGECNVEEWKEIIDIRTDGIHTIGLKSDGTVVFAGTNYNGADDISDWSDIKLISANRLCVFGIKRSGELVYAGLPPAFITEREYSLKNVVEVNSDGEEIIELNEDGTLFLGGMWTPQNSKLQGYNINN